MFYSITHTNLGQFSKPGSVLKSAGSDNFKAPHSMSIWPSFGFLTFCSKNRFEKHQYQQEYLLEIPGRYRMFYQLISKTNGLNVYFLKMRSSLTQCKICNWHNSSGLRLYGSMRCNFWTLGMSHLALGKVRVTTSSKAAWLRFLVIPKTSE